MRSPRPIPLPCLDRALIALAILCMLTMPVQYHGGADVPHPHAIFQFWDSGNADAPNHHGHSHAPPSTSSPTRADTAHTISADSLAVGSRLLPAYWSKSGNGPSNARAAAEYPPPDVPALSKMIARADRAVGLAVFILAAILLMPLTPLRRLPLPRIRIPASLATVPDAPPPRSIHALP